MGTTSSLADVLERPAPGSIPTSPGVYRFRDGRNHVIYVGKAKNLRARLGSYFAEKDTLHPRTASMVDAARSLDWVVVGTEVEALTLEYAWIKEFDPRFNVRFRDDKSYPFLAVTTGEEWPRVSVVREAKRKGVRYFGPFAHAWAIRETLDELTKVFPVRTCTQGTFRSAQRTQRACLLAHIGKCAAPCIGAVEPQEYRRIVDDLCRFLTGQGRDYLDRLAVAMQAASEAQEYEQAARIRDRLAALERVMERNAVVLPDATDADLIALADDPLQIAVQIFHVRHGQLTGEQRFIVERTEDLELSEYVDRILQRVYERGVVNERDIPREVLLSHASSSDAVGEWLTGLKGSSVRISVPQRGDRASLMASAQVNAAQALEREKARRTSDLSARSIAIRELQEFLNLPEPPLRIECIDISTLQGTDTVASLVVFEDGLPRKADYRTYGIKTPGADDLKAVHEVVHRRFARESDGDDVSADSAAGESSSEPLKFRYPVSLLVIDGAQGQVRAAQAALREWGIIDIPVVGLAKRMEEVWCADLADPVILPRSSEALYLLQRIRDEAHRVAIGFHRKRRSQRLKSVSLETIPGLGPARAQQLLRHFGSVKAVGEASLDELTSVDGVGPQLARRIQQALTSQALGVEESPNSNRSDDGHE